MQYVIIYSPTLMQQQYRKLSSYQHINGSGIFIDLLLGLQAFYGESITRIHW